MKILDQQETGTCQKTVTIEVPRDEVTAQMEDVYKEFMSHASVPGFRKGKAPRHILKMKFGKHIEGEAMSKAIEKSYEDALDELDVHAVSQPEITDLEKDDESKPITYKAKFEYVPDVEIAEYKDIRPEPPSTEVSEKEVVKMLEQLQERNATYAPIEDRAVQDKDFVTISSDAKLGDEPFENATHDEIIIEVGSKRYIPGFEEELVGMKVDESKTFTLNLPDE